MKILIIFYILFGFAQNFKFVSTISNSAFASESTYTSAATSVSCASSPGCPDCGSCSCTNTLGYCTDHFTVMPTANNIVVTTIPFISSYTDTASGPCGSNSKTCYGGTSTCKVSKLPVALDSVLTQWSPDLHKLKANNVTCKYNDPVCNTCCVSWSCSCYTCPPPPPPLPAPSP